MEELQQYVIQYAVSNILALLCLVSVFQKPVLTRIALAALFLWASYINTKTALYTPGVYLEYSRFAFLSLYKDFINGFFSAHIREFVVPIAISQFLIAVGLLLNNVWTKFACFAGILFGLAIGPLGIGSAFPATLIMAIVFLVLLTKYDHDFIWKNNESSLHKRKYFHLNNLS